MSYIKNCLACGREIQGQINKVFCRDACRKRHKRRGGILPIEGISEEQLNTVREVSNENDTQKENKNSTSKNNNGLEHYFFKKVIDVGASLIETQLKEGIKGKNNPAVVTPLILQSGNDVKSNSTPCSFSVDMMEFLGKISYPFKMLVWGLPGEGKSTFCMKLADEIAREYSALYIMAEESLNSDSLQDKKRRVLHNDRLRKVAFVNRLPVLEQEWKGLLLEEKDKSKVNYSTLFYDSVTKMDITPFYIDQAAGLYKMNYFKELLSHVFVTHAHKDGTMYRGDGSWAHEVDVVIRCKQGIAYIEKNRFGIVGKEFRIY